MNGRPQYNLQKLPDDWDIFWENHKAPPAIGKIVQIGSPTGPLNGVVTGYFMMSGELGIEVQLDEMPLWLKNSRARAGVSLMAPVRVFGASLRSQSTST